jgi:hypothetical protein
MLHTYILVYTLVPTPIYHGRRRPGWSCAPPSCRLPSAVCRLPPAVCHQFSETPQRAQPGSLGAWDGGGMSNAEARRPTRESERRYCSLSAAGTAKVRSEVRRTCESNIHTIRLSPLALSIQPSVPSYPNCPVSCESTVGADCWLTHRERARTFAAVTLINSVEPLLSLGYRCTYEH